MARQETECVAGWMCQGQVICVFWWGVGDLLDSARGDEDVFQCQAEMF